MEERKKGAGEGKKDRWGKKGRRRKRKKDGGKEGERERRKDGGEEGRKEGGEEEKKKGEKKRGKEERREGGKERREEEGRAGREREVAGRRKGDGKPSIKIQDMRNRMSPLELQTLLFAVSAPPVNAPTTHIPLCSSFLLPRQCEAVM